MLEIICIIFKKVFLSFNIRFLKIRFSTCYGLHFQSDEYYTRLAFALKLCTLLVFFSAIHSRFLRCVLFFEIIIRVEIPTIYGLINTYIFLRVNCNKIMHARWNSDAPSALVEHQNWSESALFCNNSRSQYAVINLILTRHK